MRKLTALTTCMALVACSGNNTGAVFALSEEVQSAAILECKNERGVPGQYGTGTFQYGANRREVLIEPGYAVSLEDARAINACARSKLTAMTTPVSTAGTAQSKSLVEMCVAQTDAPGAYDWQQQGDLPIVRSLAELGGTQEGADMINACIRQNAVVFQNDAAQVAQPVPAAEPPVFVEPEMPASTPMPVRSDNPMCPVGIVGLYRGNIIC